MRIISIVLLALAAGVAYSQTASQKTNAQGTWSQSVAPSGVTVSVLGTPSSAYQAQLAAQAAAQPVRYIVYQYLTLSSGTQVPLVHSEATALTAAEVQELQGKGYTMVQIR